MIPLVVGVTSHRDIPASEVEPIRQRVRAILCPVEGRVSRSCPSCCLSSLAEGGDQLVADEALACGARLIAPLPLPRDLYPRISWMRWCAALRNLVRPGGDVLLPSLMAKPRHVIGAPGVARDRQYAKAGVYIASHCHMLLAIWDGKDTGGLGGTAQIVDYHLTGTPPGLIARHLNRAACAGWRRREPALSHGLLAIGSRGEPAAGSATVAGRLAHREATPLLDTPAGGVPADVRAHGGVQRGCARNTPRKIEVAPQHRWHGTPDATATIERCSTPRTGWPSISASVCCSPCA